MVEENKDEEYRFKEETPSSSYPSFPGGKDAMEKMGRQAILGAIGLIFIIFFAYRLISWIFSTEPQKKTATPPLSPPAQVIHTPAPQPSVSSETENEIKSRLSQDEQSLTQMQSTLSGIQDQLNAVNGAVQNFGGQLKQIQDEIIALKPKPTPKKPVAEVAKPSYYVKALVPGRAWLNAEGGSTLTVSPGDQLPGYGVVTEIDVDQGAILTSSGDIIRFHPTDS